MIRRPLLVLAIACTACLVVSRQRAEAQSFFNGGTDPFSFYYNYYLPHAAAIAAQPTPLDTINQVTAARQYTALSERAGLYDPISPYGEEDLDPNRPLARRGGERLARPGAFTQSTSNIRGTGPAVYYSRTARYHPYLRAGRGPNRNIAVTKRGGSGMGGGMMGGGGMAGPR